MNVAAIVRELAQVDAWLEVRGASLRVHVLSGDVIPALLERLRPCKSKLLRELSDAAFWDRAAIAEIEAVADPDVRADLRMRYEARAAIMEYDRGKDRKTAEMLAALEVIRRIAELNQQGSESPERR